MKKTIAVILLIVCLSTMLAACAPKDNEGSSTPNTTQSVEKPSYHNEDAPPTEDELANAKG